MENIIKYKISLPVRTFSVEIHLNKDCHEMIKAFVEGFGISPDAVAVSRGDYDLCCRVIALDVYRVFQSLNYIDLYKEDFFRRFQLRLDGSWGIELIDIDFPEILEESFVVDILDPNCPDDYEDDYPEFI